MLIIDDELELRESLKSILTQEGFEVSVASDGFSGLQMIKSEKIPVVLCDITMPDLDGLQVLEKLREMGLPCALIFLTAHSDSERILQALRLGALDYLVKPFNPQALAKKLEVWKEIGKRMQSVSSNEASQADALKFNLRMIELLKIKNSKAA